MGKTRRYWLLGWALVGTSAVVPYATGCSTDDSGSIDADDEGELPGPSRGSAIVLAADDRVAVAVNRDVGSVSVLALDYAQEGYSKDGSQAYLPTVTKKAEIDLGKGSEPWQVVISPNGTHAYVVLRHSQEVVRISDLRDQPHEDGRVKVGSEPTGIAMSPSGKRLYVANWVDGTLSEVNAKSMKVDATIDLNAALAATKLLGDVAPRPSLAHPRSVAVTSNLDGKDEDESILVTEYFAQRTAPLAADGANADTSMQGIVYKVNVGTRSVSTIPLAPLADMGFKDHLGGTAGCFPNQLQSVTIAGAYAYVSSVCASPKGPIGVVTTTTPPNVASVKTAHAPVVSVIDIAKGTEIKEATASLNAKFDALYTQRATADDASRRYPHMPADIAFVPKPIFKNGHGKPIDETPGGSAWVAANAADGIFRVKYDLGANSALTEVGSSTKAFVDAGKNPIGIAIGYTGRTFALVNNDVTRDVSVIDLSTGTSAATVSVAAVPAAGSPEDSVLKGKRFFNTGMARWSLKGQAWGSCQTCHSDGLTDNVSWFFARGPRQSTSLDGTFSKKNPNDQRMLNWSAINDEADDFELNTRGISGGVGATVSVVSVPPAVTDRIDIAALGLAGLNGSAAAAADPTNPQGLTPAGMLNDWRDITNYMKTIRSPRAASNLDAAKVDGGRQVFEDSGCTGCHSGDKWTISTRFYAPSKDTMTALAAKSWTAPAGFPATLLPATTPSNQLMRFPSTNGALDSMQCILRPVGTFGANDGRAGAAELRADMKTPAQGNEVDGKGFNPPSLLAMSTGAPYLHNGGALTLESLFSTQFSSHHGALKPVTLDAQKTEWLVQYILSLDGDARTYPIPAAGADGGDFCAKP